MKVTPISMIGQLRNPPPRKPPHIHKEPTPEMKALQRYESLCQKLYDSLITFVDAKHTIVDGEYVIVVKEDTYLNARQAIMLAHVDMEV